MRIGTVYLLHFDRPYHHARHYLGFATDLAARIAMHRAAGRGSRLTWAIRKAGIGFTVARTWEGVSQAFEARLHRSYGYKGLRSGNAARCPICSGPSAARRGRPKPKDYG